MVQAQKKRLLPPIDIGTIIKSTQLPKNKNNNNNVLLCVHCFSVNDEEVRLMLWDTAGQEEFDAITKAYYRGKSSLL